MCRTAPMEIEDAVWVVAEKVFAVLEDKEAMSPLLDAIVPYPDLVTNPDERERCDIEALQRLRARLRPLVVTQIREFAHDPEIQMSLRRAEEVHRSWGGSIE